MVERQYAVFPDLCAGRRTPFVYLCFSADRNSSMAVLPGPDRTLNKVRPASAPAVQGLIQFPHKGAQISAPQADGVFIPLPIAPGKAGTAASADLEDCVTQAAQSRRGTAPPRKGSHPPPQQTIGQLGKPCLLHTGEAGLQVLILPQQALHPAGRLKGLGGKQIGDPPVLAQHPIQIAQGPGRRRAAPPARPPGTSVRREA